jgi:hypothetical protein
MLTARADTIDENLKALEEIASTLNKQVSDLAIEVHRLWVDLSEGIADLRGETPNACNCDECDCKEVCGWTKPHTVVEGSCSNCGTFTQYGEESMIEFECETHGNVSWSR